MPTMIPQSRRGWRRIPPSLPASEQTRGASLGIMVTIRPGYIDIDGRRWARTDGQSERMKCWPITLLALELRLLIMIRINERRRHYWDRGWRPVLEVSARQRGDACHRQRKCLIWVCRFSLPTTPLTQASPSAHIHHATLLYSCTNADSCQLAAQVMMQRHTRFAGAQRARAASSMAPVFRQADPISPKFTRWERSDLAAGTRRYCNNNGQHAARHRQLITIPVLFQRQRKMRQIFRHSRAGIYFSVPVCFPAPRELTRYISVRARSAWISSNLRTPQEERVLYLPYLHSSSIFLGLQRLFSKYIGRRIWLPPRVAR